MFILNCIHFDNLDGSILKTFIYYSTFLIILLSWTQWETKVWWLSLELHTEEDRNKRQVYADLRNGWRHREKCPGAQEVGGESLVHNSLLSLTPRGEVSGHPAVTESQWPRQLHPSGPSPRILQQETTAFGSPAGPRAAYTEMSHPADLNFPSF